MRANRLFIANRWRWLVLAILAAGPAVCGALLHEVVSPAEARSSAAADGATGALPSAAVRIRIEALGTQRGGVTGLPRVANDVVLGVGETATRYLRAGDETTASVCRAKFIDPSAEIPRRLVWRLQARAVEVVTDETTVELRWTRSGEGDESRNAKQGTRTITLGPTDYHVLDYVENPDAASRCASLLIRISAQPIVEQDRRPVSVDVWTVDEDTATGQSRSVHQNVRGVTGQAIPFTFPPLDVAGLDAGGSRVSVSVEGTLQAAEAPDGLVDVSVAARRRTSWAGAETRGEGRVQFRAVQGETAALLLPQPTGTLGRSGAVPAGPATLDLARAFAGHRLSLYVKVDSGR
jgi:hypothetical protein